MSRPRLPAGSLSLRSAELRLLSYTRATAVSKSFRSRTPQRTVGCHAAGRPEPLNEIGLESPPCRAPPGTLQQVLDRWRCRTQFKAGHVLGNRARARAGNPAGSPRAQSTPPGAPWRIGCRSQRVQWTWRIGPRNSAMVSAPPVGMRCSYQYISIRGSRRDSKQSHRSNGGASWHCFHVSNDPP
jgi:hypothetical protein